MDHDPAPAQAPSVEQFFIFGARGCGKSTFVLKQFLPPPWKPDNPH
jgi:hypothetical protein